MMHERKKIGEAKYFYSRIRELVNDQEPFTYNLSAFLSSSRSVLQYVLEEVKRKTNGQAWYDSRVNNPALQFFKDKRDTTIHAMPVELRKDISITSSPRALTIPISDSYSIIVIDKDGKETEQVSSSLSQPPPISPEIRPETVVTYEYFFADWKGPEDVLSLCQKYLLELETIVEDGIVKGFLTDR